MRVISIAFTLFCLGFFSTNAISPAQKDSQERVSAYKNPELPVEQRAEDLLSRMTLEEKVAQTLTIWPLNDKSIFTDDGVFDSDKAVKVLYNGIGEVARLEWGHGPKAGAELVNTVQRFLVENTRLGIPAITHGEGLHGYMAVGATHFPQAIALASTWDDELTEKIYSVVAKEMRARGISQALTPVLGLAREPRWGRTEETFGEDPYLVTKMGVASVKGFQGTGPFIDNEHVISTVKHFAVYSQPERGINYSPGNFSERIIRENFLKPFQAAITEAGAHSVMPSYNEIDGVPLHANRKFLQNILREEWGFDGIVVADYSGISQLITRHYVAHDKYEAAKMALEAGVDIELPSIDCNPTIIEQIKDGRISEKTLDKAVLRILRMKFLLGLFENPYADPSYAEKITNCKEHADLALEAAYNSAVLLKNDNNMLPLDKNAIKSLAIIGPNAADIHLGGYSWEPRTGISILEGIRNKVGKDIEVKYALGCKITENVPLWGEDEVIKGDPVKNAERIKEAVKVAKSCDVAILVIGGNEGTCREGWMRSHLGDRDNLDMVGEQNDLVKAVLETGTPTVVFLMNGRPLSINYVKENVPAIIEGWYMGQETGTAAADILFGDVNPGGKLPITFPKSAGQIPAYYNHKPSTDQNYLFVDKEPLFPFGYGLSYTTFEYANLRVSGDRIGPAGTCTVSVDVTNTGKRAGDEVVQLYIRDDVSSVTRPVKELKGFQRITLKPGETHTVSLDITPDELSFLDINMKRIVEPGTFTIMVGGNSVDLDTVTLEIVGK
ncbi:glycoside hydrolase family 3 N-terminal domain-containing protein [Candidatus Latescibacterota bacterium]